jgi:uncharacterized protein (DUF697 family)
MIDPEDIPSLLKKAGALAEKKFADAISSGGKKREEETQEGREHEPWPPMRNDIMQYMEPDWDEIDKKANLIVARYAVVSGAANILPFGLDIVAVTATFTKMTTELAGVYQVIVSSKRARQMGGAIAATTGTVLGAVYAGSRLAKFIPGGYFYGVLVQAPLVGAVAWAAGDALKDYFKQCRKGKDPGLQQLTESFARTLHLRVRKVKPTVAATNGPAPTASPTPTPTPAAAPEPLSPSDAVDKLASLHELLRAGAITQDEYDAKKTELLRLI